MRNQCGSLIAKTFRPSNRKQYWIVDDDEDLVHDKEASIVEDDDEEEMVLSEAPDDDGPNRNENDVTKESSVDDLEKEIEATRQKMKELEQMRSKSSSTGQNTKKRKVVTLHADANKKQKKK